ncbi:hypothetical protein GCM10009133_39130 [Cocleimonas flava]|uniref:Uncharacterized protein n=1 Tax=Cocleimonas flava TaxID=634765 RepID=A0A4R1F6T7_9GAMM|nr:hypothetical protein [Cocleimonas flava]TCJ88249.1 hypothetical protein EV695_0089 [Cocleimonas flava]
MNNQKHTVNEGFREPKVYSTTGFKDTLASPLFYSVAAVALVLGIASIFGFLQNPLKLKAVANAVHNKVHISSPVRSSPRNNLYSLEQSFKNKDYRTDKNQIQNQPQSVEVEQPQHMGGLNRVSFNYDVTANDFWTDLDTSRLESAVEESARQDLEASLLGAPLGSEFHQQLELEAMPLNDSIYSLNTTPTSI